MPNPLTPRIPELNDQQASPEAVVLFEATRNRIGTVPNVYRAMANAPQILSAFATLLNATETSSLDRRLQQLIAVQVAQFDQSSYCLAVNTAVGLHVGATPEELVAARKQQSSNPSYEAALTFVGALLRKHGAVNDAEVEMLQKAGFDNRQVAETIACVAMNLFANYFNLVARTTLDFPCVALELDRQ